MRKIIILILCFSIQILFVYGNQNKNQQKQLITVIHYSNGKACLFFDSKLLYERIKQTTIEKKSLENAAENIQLEIFPNPISKNSKISFNLITNSDVKIYTYDNNFSVKNLFEGRLNQGTQDFSFDLADLNKGLVIFYIEIDGNVYLKKAIKI